MKLVLKIGPLIDLFDGVRPTSIFFPGPFKSLVSLYNNLLLRGIWHRNDIIIQVFNASPYIRHSGTVLNLIGQEASKKRI